MSRNRNDRDRNRFLRYQLEPLQHKPEIYGTEEKPCKILVENEALGIAGLILVYFKPDWYVVLKVEEHLDEYNRDWIKNLINEFSNSFPTLEKLHTSNGTFQFCSSNNELKSPAVTLSSGVETLRSELVTALKKSNPSFLLHYVPPCALHTEEMNKNHRNGK